jgi:hypothetical protein
MRRLTWLALAAVAALAASSVAVAHLKSADVSAVSATFAAPTAAHLRTSTSTCDGETIEVTTARYTGTATSTTGDLNGPVELRVHSVYNATTKLGWVDGTLKIRGADGKTTARLTAVNVDGKLDGWLRGNAGRGDGMLLGSLTATFDKAAGLSAGAIGTGAGANAAVLAKRTSCKRESVRPSVRLHVRGTVESVSTTALAVKPHDGGATQTCAITAASPRTSGLEAGDRVEATCAQVSGSYVLVKLERKRR